MNGDAHPLIIYIPGLLPKPEPEVHRDALLRCLLAGVRRIDEGVAKEIETTTGAFDIVSWTYDFYHEHRDFGIDAAAVDAVIEQEVATPQDVAEATSWKRQVMRWIYALGDMLPFLIPHVANERMEVHLRDLRRYLRDDNGIATHVRRMLKMRLRAASESRHPTMLIAHSMGSVIAYDTLWEMSESGRDHLQLDMLLTMGSPLGQRYMQKRLRGADQRGFARYPANIRRWRNLSAVGDMTALNPYLSNDFDEMLELGILESFEDEVIHTHFRLDGVLNVHAEYGYLVNARTAHAVIDWWRQYSA